MDSFDKKISDLYNADQSSSDLPEGFGWEDMNEGIYEKMEEPKRKKRFIWMWFSFGGSLFLLAALLFFFKPETENTASISSKIEGTKAEKTPILLDKTTIENNLEITKKIQKTPTETKEIFTTSTILNSDKTSKENNKRTKLVEHSSSSIPSISSESSVNNYKNNLELFREKTIQKSTLSTTEAPSSTKAKVEEKPVNKKKVLKERFVVTKRLAFIPIQELLIPTKTRLAPPIVITPSLAKSPKDKNPDGKKSDPKNKVKLNRFSAVQLYGGTLLTSGTYSQNPLRNKHSSWLPGYYAGIELTVLNYKKWKINLGYEHKFAVQLFDFQNITDLVDTVVVDALVGISTNSINGTRRENRETISTQATRFRNYVNYNTFRSHAFRMTFVRTFNLSKNLSFNAGVGGSFNFLNQANGRTVDSDEDTLNYSPKNSIYRKNNFGIEGGFSLSYQIGKFSLNGNVWMEKSLNYSLESVGEIRPVFYKIGLGVGRRF